MKFIIYSVLCTLLVSQEVLCAATSRKDGSTTKEVDDKPHYLITLSPVEDGNSSKGINRISRSSNASHVKGSASEVTTRDPDVPTGLGPEPIIPDPITTSTSSTSTTVSTSTTITSTTPSTSTISTSSSKPTKPPSSTTPTPSTTPAPHTTVSPTPTSPHPDPTSAPAPKKGDRSFDGLSFFAGIVLSAGLLAIGVVAYKFYEARRERNYHTL